MNATIFLDANIEHFIILKDYIDSYHEFWVDSIDADFKLYIM